jgi:hypothetical protein
MLLVVAVLLASPLAGQAAGAQGSVDDLMALVASSELGDLPKDVNTKAALCVGLGEGGITDEQLRSLRTAVPRLSLKPYTIDCLVPVTDWLYVRVWSQDPEGATRILAQWSRKADDTCFSESIRRRVYEATSEATGWRITSIQDQQPWRATPKP